MTIPMKKTVKKATEADIGKHVFATDLTYQPSMQQVEKGCTDRRRKLAAVIPDEYSPEEPFITVRSDGSVSAWRHVYIIHEEPVPYTEGQEASGLKPGDWVKVTRKAADGEAGWSDIWPEEMDRFVGSVGKVDRISSGSGGIFLDGCGYYRYPYFVLEKITTRPACAGDAGKKCIHHNNEHTIDTIFQSSDGKLWAVLKSASGVIGVTELEKAQVILDQPQAQAPKATRPDWLPEGWRQLGLEEVIKESDKVQSNYYPDPPRSGDPYDMNAWSGVGSNPYVRDNAGKKVKDSKFPKDVWIRKVE